MNKLKKIIENIIPNEIEQDKAVFENGYILSPIYSDIALKGDGKPTEIITGYQLDFFLKAKGETVAKAKSLIIELSDYPVGSVNYVWEETVRLWRATVTIETI